MTGAERLWGIHIQKGEQISSLSVPQRQTLWIHPTTPGIRRGAAGKSSEENLRLGSVRHPFHPLLDHAICLGYADRMYEEKEIKADGIRTWLLSWLGKMAKSLIYFSFLNLLHKKECKKVLHDMSWVMHHKVRWHHIIELYDECGKSSTQTI